MYQKSCLRQNEKIKDNIFDKQFPLHNRTHEVIYRNLFSYFYLMPSVQIFFVAVFFTKLELKSLSISEIIYQRLLVYLFCGLTSDLHIFSKFACKLFMTMY